MMEKNGVSPSSSHVQVPRTKSKLFGGLSEPNFEGLINFEKDIVFPDFVLVWKLHKPHDEPGGTPVRRDSKVKTRAEIRRDDKRRRIFLRNLAEVGLRIELADDSVGLYKFAKLYIKKNKQVDKTPEPDAGAKAGQVKMNDNGTDKEKELLRKYAEVLNKKPLDNTHEADKTTEPGPSKQPNGVPPDKGKDLLRKYAEIIKLRVPMKKLPGQPDDVPVMGVYSRDKEYLFNMDDEAKVFNYSNRARIVEFILSRTSYSENEHNKTACGINRLINFGVFEAAYPVHDPVERDNLHTEWGTMWKFYKQQPLDEINDYFGVKVALYFSWLGYYTFMLIPAAIVGFFCFVYGWATVKNDKIINDICDNNIEEKMCPTCDKCGYWEILSFCNYSKATYLFDNEATIFLAFFMSLWSAVFMGFWKTYSSSIDHTWGLTSFEVEDEQPRPEYMDELERRRRKMKKSSRRDNSRKNNLNESLPFWTRTLPYTTVSVIAVMVLITIPLFFVLASILGQYAFISQFLEDDSRLAAKIFISICAALCELAFLLVFNAIYESIAHMLTELELPRTDTAFDTSLTLKLYVVEFINYYAPPVYVAFFQGKYVGTPGRYRRSFGLRLDECSPVGCMTELFIQLTVILVGKLIIDTVKEIVTPYIKRKWRLRQSKVGLAPLQKQKPWEKDFYLEDFGGPQSLFPDYLEMVMQYGLVTLFVAGFPLAPLFALIKNVVEVRLKARKFLMDYRRPVAQRVKDLGSWGGILAWVSRITIITNALVIALTSSFIPKFMYYVEFGTFEGYLDFVLEKFNTSDPTFQRETAPELPGEDVDTCRYFAFIRRPDLEGREEQLWPERFRERELFYWRVWLARLIFVIMFQNVVTLFVEILKWLIPPVPKKLAKRILREQGWIMEAILQRERMLGRDESITLLESPSPKKKKKRKMKNEDATKDAIDTDTVDLEEGSSLDSLDEDDDLDDEDV